MVEPIDQTDDPRKAWSTGLDNDRNPYRFSEGSDPREFSPNALTYDIR